MRTHPPLRRLMIGAVTVLALAACGDDAATEVAADTPADADRTGASDDGADGTEATAAGTAVVVIGDERYATSELGCDGDVGGAEYFASADGPRANARIHGRFATSLPDLVGVSFARGDEGEYRALAENDLLDHGVLENYEYDEHARTMTGTAEFVWIDEDGLAHLDDLVPGTFEIRC